MGIFGRTPRTRIAAYGVIIDGGNILLARWISRDGPKWTLPGGGVDFGEDPYDGAIREVAEETGYVFEPDTLLGIDSVHVPDEPYHGVRVIYTGRVVGGELTFEKDGSTDMAAWMPLDDLDRHPRAHLLDTALRLHAAKPASGHVER